MNIMGASDKALGALIVLYFLRTGQATKIPWAGNIFSQAGNKSSGRASYPTLQLSDNSDK